MNLNKFLNKNLRGYVIKLKKEEKKGRDDYNIFKIVFIF